MTKNTLIDKFLSPTEYIATVESIIVMGMCKEITLEIWDKILHYMESYPFSNTVNSIENSGVSTCNILGNGFIWSRTKEGHNYWSGLSKNLRRLNNPRLITVKDEKGNLIKKVPRKYCTVQNLNRFKQVLEVVEKLKLK